MDLSTLDGTHKSFARKHFAPEIVSNCGWETQFLLLCFALLFAEFLISCLLSFDFKNDF